MALSRRKWPRDKTKELLFLAKKRGQQAATASAGATFISLCCSLGHMDTFIVGWIPQQFLQEDMTIITLWLEIQGPDTTMISAGLCYVNKLANNSSHAWANLFLWWRVSDDAALLRIILPTMEREKSSSSVMEHYPESGSTVSHSSCLPRVQ